MILCVGNSHKSRLKSLRKHSKVPSHPCGSYFSLQTMKSSGSILLQSFIDDRLRLLWSCSLLPHTQFLSLDVQRVICEYLADSLPTQLVAVFAENLRVLSLLDEEMRCSKPAIDFALGCLLYPIRENVVICVGGRGTNAMATLNVETHTVEQLRPMLKARSFPGVAKVAELLYIFGGTDEEDMVESEAYTLGRRPSHVLPNMRYARSMFSACKHMSEILLPGGAPFIESFNILSETYTVLEVLFPFQGMATVSVVVGDELVCLCMLNQVGRWQLGSSGKFQVKAVGKITSGAMVYSSSPAVLHFPKLYFADVTGNFTIYDIPQNTLYGRRREFL